MRGFITGSLVLIVLHTALTSKYLIESTNVFAELLKRGLSPDVPAIPDLRKSGSSGSNKSSSKAGKWEGSAGTSLSEDAPAALEATKGFATSPDGTWLP
jgi:hypothetical protein